jgi:hypothetical protein
MPWVSTSRLGHEHDVETRREELERAQLGITIVTVTSAVISGSHVPGHLEVLPLRFRLSSFRIERTATQTRVAMMIGVLDRDTGEPRELDVVYEHNHPRGDVTQEPDAVVLRKALLKMFEHELDEVMLLDGRRIKEPHPEDAPVHPPEGYR